MNQQFVADGEERLIQSEEFQAKLDALRMMIRAKYAAELAASGFFRRCALRWRIGAEFRRERRLLCPSPQALYSSCAVAIGSKDGSR